MDVLTDTMSTTQMQSKTGRVDSYDAMIEAERKMYSILDAQAAVKAEDYAYDDEEDALTAAIRRDASDDLFAGYKAGKASEAVVKAENDAYDEEDALTADDFYAGYRIGKASQMQSKTGRVDSYDGMIEAEREMYSIPVAAQAAVKAEDYEEDAIDKLFRKKINLMRARRDARYEFRMNHHV